MPTPIVRPELMSSPESPFLVAGELTQSEVREVPPHSHARGQIMAALGGLASVGVDKHRWVVPAIYAIWIPPHWVHSVRSYGPFSGWSVFIAEHRCATLPAAPRAIRTTPLLREAVRRAASWPGGELDDAQLRIAEVIMDELRGAPAESLGLPRPDDARLARITDALANDLSDDRQLAQWAAWVGLAPRTLSRRFLSETGMTFAQWRQKARLLRALELVADRVPVTAIALQLGYDNVSAFIDMFRRAFGTTPGRYLASQRATGADGA
ncbi:helix-turn-helix transcriptional regulator [Trinickia caryophylli]|uniref:Transcriptional regulator, AraC family n=1 Tax=Trinickia caryophylli TaxID=28094 RepID=A0A1X7FUQ1_TRICW|nr:helix-turn-helix transcriptional regulator [Trinickia caryophylli]PMS11916.1 AraC family transcriptional regulator [Trinickia caryophylli]TRX14007.1 helix-turn-helix transcriptional regulator [Trinickia caryophylli]WQE15604.1 helix-turn-helix transcriptional regulator [Trinickia caryophylli]SMF58475.1 transcriptional regulator, AraC family [Trinickia caryophylli]GLU33635.1 AraC family transcriptional regulator [Trinickia caryophylli]